MNRGKAAIFVVNVVLCMTFGLGVLIFNQVGRPYIRGFYCDDDSINKPYKSSTISSINLVITCVTLTVCTVFFVESVNSRLSLTYSQHGCFSAKYLMQHPALMRSVWVLIAWLYGMGITQFMVDVGKYSVGRLRPHFLSACNPDWSKMNCTRATGPVHNFIIGDEFCRWTVTKNYQREARLSFPSGHSSFAAYCGFFLILYIEVEFRYGGTYKRVPKLFIEATMAVLAFLTMLSRVSDYKHHPSDVLAGCLLGLIVAPIIIFRVLRLGRRSYAPVCEDRVAENKTSRNSVEDV